MCQWKIGAQLMCYAGIKVGLVKCLQQHSLQDVNYNISRSSTWAGKENVMDIVTG